MIKERETNLSSGEWKIEPQRDQTAALLAARGDVRPAADYYLVTPPSLLREPVSYRVWRDRPSGEVRCSCPDYRAAGNPSFRCEHILAVKHFILAQPITEYRPPDGSIRQRKTRRLESGDGSYATTLRAVQINLVHAAMLATRLLRLPASRCATFKVGMPEALLETLEQCGDREAARLACQAFLERTSAAPAEATPQSLHPRESAAESAAAGVRGRHIFLQVEGERGRKTVQQGDGKGTSRLH